MNGIRGGGIGFLQSHGEVIKIGLAEESESASSYRGEILGEVLAQLILRVATVGTACSNCVVEIYCGDKGVLCHGQDRDMRMKENQAQADGLWSMKKLTQANAVGIEHVWVKAHVDKKKGRPRTMKQVHNDMVESYNWEYGWVGLR